MNKDVFYLKMESGLKALNLPRDNYLLDRYWTYLQFLLEENKKYNLTAIDDIEGIINRHFLDSLIILNKIELNQGNSVIDIGTGAGFPGMVLKLIRPDLNIVLLDSRKKRIEFLKLLAARLNLDSDRKLEIINGRAEIIACQEKYRESFDLVVSRAVAAMNTLSEYTIPFIKVNGQAVLYKSNDWEQELAEAKKAVKILGGEIARIIRVEIPGINEPRSLVVIKKKVSTPEKYPRREGIPKKRPL